MSWNQLTLDVPDDLTDAVIGALPDDGIAGVWEAGEPVAGLTRLVVYLAGTVDVEALENCIHSIFMRSGCRVPVISRSLVEDRDWTQEWRKSYNSFPVGDEFFVIPSWSDASCPADRMPIRIDPGQAFGTGTHETTQLMIEALERWVESHHTVLDVGTGSGILAIASRLLGAGRVFACDIDPVAVRIAQANIDRNAEDHVWTFCASVHAVAGASIGLALCNLTADVILSLFPDIDRVVQPRGIAVFSGILQEQIEPVQDVMKRFHFTIHEQLSRGEWLAFVTEKHGA